ncbi:hypothetical protein K458DRAFT_393651 [Lentithecium fluviatile CBS 122367]|uniref:Uncharacterized protein n=1 Tax=Lentithecium fluviatile CBS 122367 TaxID=1168545 RepID=A0A6G1IP94_9PLEO|nr:hypothetical protein K458DRAFT_393651 [Lentithecium fluviatile CBS 122367]
MSTPTRRFSDANFSSGGPSRSVLQMLLEEINNNNDNAPGRPRAESLSYSKTRAGPICRPHCCQAPSAWVGGNSAAEDARKKLRALDEARQRKKSSDCLRSTPESADGPDEQIFPQRGFKSVPPDLTQPKTFQLMFGDVQFGRAATWSNTDEPSPTSECPPNNMQCKREREWSYSSSQDVMLKRIRIGSPDGRLSDRQHSLSDGGDTIMRGGGPIVISSAHPHQSGPVERNARRSASFAEQSVARHISSLRHLEEVSQSPGYPSTPCRSYSSIDGSASPSTTPAWMKPFHLVDEDKSIYMNVHGEDWRDHQLCLQCFRRHGNFHRMMPYGCEVCGQDEILKGHYWELPDREPRLPTPNSRSSSTSAASYTSTSTASTASSSQASIFSTLSRSSSRSAPPPEHFYAGRPGEGVQRTAHLFAAGLVFGTYDLGSGRRGAISSPSAMYYEGAYERVNLEDRRCVEWKGEEGGGDDDDGKDGGGRGNASGGRCEQGEENARTEDDGDDEEYSEIRFSPFDDRGNGDGENEEAG